MAPQDGGLWAWAHAATNYLAWTSKKPRPATYLTHTTQLPSNFPHERTDTMPAHFLIHIPTMTRSSLTYGAASKSFYLCLLDNIQIPHLFLMSARAKGPTMTHAYLSTPHEDEQNAAPRHIPTCARGTRTHDSHIPNHKDLDEQTATSNKYLSEPPLHISQGFHIPQLASDQVICQGQS